MTTISALIDVFTSGFREMETRILYFESAKQLYQTLPEFEVVLFQSWVNFSKKYNLCLTALCGVI